MWRKTGTTGVNTCTDMRHPLRFCNGKVEKRYHLSMKKKVFAYYLSLKNESLLAWVCSAWAVFISSYIGNSVSRRLTGLLCPLSLQQMDPPGSFQSWDYHGLWARDSCFFLPLWLLHLLKTKAVRLQSEFKTKISSVLSSDSIFSSFGIKSPVMAY